MKLWIFSVAALFYSLGTYAQSDTSRIRVVEEPGIAVKMQAYMSTGGSKPQSAKGYRIQIFNGSRADANKHKADFARRYPDLSVYTIYETPEYRVQAGDYTDSFEAERKLREIRAEFPGAFMVRTTVNPRR